MNQESHPSPFELLLLVTSLLEAHDLRLLQPWLPFMKQAPWASRGLLLDGPRDLGFEAMEEVIHTLRPDLADQGLRQPEQVLGFIICDWEAMEASLMEGILHHLAHGYPRAAVRALPLHYQ